MLHTKLEDGIHKVWAVQDLIKDLIWRYVDHPKPMSEDEVWNNLEAISAVLDLQCEKLFDTYCQVFELDDYASDEVKAYREAVLREAFKKKTKKAK